MSLFESVMSPGFLGSARTYRRDVEIAVLGPVEIRGAARPFCRSSAKELVVYLAFHREGVRTDVWATALWADRSVAPSTLHSTASVARRALGRASNGTDHLPRTGRRLQLADTVRTDVERFAEAAADPDPSRWKEALGLVRGRAFDGLGLADWAVLEGTQARVESLVVDTALRGAEHHLRRGCGEEAEWMIRRALQVSPYDERLYRVLLRAVETMGNRVGLRVAMADLLLLAADGGMPRRQPPTEAMRVKAPSPLHPRTVALFHELTRGYIPATWGDPSRL
jgi:DNA-binding SARP family transcriptional activator